MGTIKRLSPRHPSNQMQRNKSWTDFQNLRKRRCCSLLSIVMVTILVSLFIPPASLSPVNGTLEDLSFKDFMPYMNQSLISPHFISTVIFNKYYSYRDILVITGMDGDKLNELINAKITDTSSTSQLAKDWVTSQFIILDEPSHFKRICSRTSRLRPVHWLHYENDNRILKWIRSKGGMNHNLKEFVIEGKEISEKTLLENLIIANDTDDNNQPICISGSSRVGNSLFMGKIGKHLSKTYPERHNVLVLEARDFIKQIRETVETMEMEKAIESVLQNRSHPVNKNVMTELLLDNFQEIDDGDGDIITEILNMVKSSFQSVRVWITTTSSQGIESKLDLLCYNLKVMMEDDQVKFLERTWSRQKNTLNEEKLKQFATISLTALHSGLDLNEHQDLAESSLQNLLLAEAYEEEATKYSRVGDGATSTAPPNITILSITDLYGSLIKKKMKTYKTFGEGNDTLDVRQVMDIHIRLSLNLLFPAQFEMLKYSLAPVEMDQIMKVRIFEEPAARSLKFRDKTVAEYFVASFIIDWLQNERYGERDELDKFLLKGALASRAMKVTQNHDLDHLSYKIQSFEFTHPSIAYFLNAFFRKRPTHNLQNFSGALNSLQNMRQIAHSCVNANFLHIFQFLERINVFDKTGSKIFNEELLYLAIEKSNLEFIKLVLAQFHLHHDFDLSVKSKALGMAVHRGEFPIVQFLIKENEMLGIVENLTRLLLHDCVLHTKNKSPQEIDDKIKVLQLLVAINPELLEQRYSFWERTPLLSEDAHIRLLTELVRLGANTLAQDMNNDTVLHWSHNKRKRLSAEDYNSLVQSIPEDKLKILLQLKTGWDEDMKTPLAGLVRYIDPLPETLERFRDAGANFSFVGGELEYSVLGYAIWHGRAMDTLRKLIECGASVDWKGSKGETLLHLAGFYGNLNAVELLIEEYGVDRHVEDEDGLTPLDYTLKSEEFFGKRIHTGLALHEHGVKFKNSLSTEGKSPFHLAAERDNSLSVHLFLLLDMNVNAVDKQGNTPLHLWVTPGPPGHLWSKDHLFITKLLLDNKADPNALNKNGETPLQSALMNGDLNFETFQLLKSQNGISLTAALATPLLELVIKKGTDLDDEEFSSLSREFESGGADFNYRDYYGNSLLHLAANHGNERVVHFLVQNKSADVNSTNKGKETPLHKAAKAHDKAVGLKIIKYLVENGANVDGKDNKDATFLKVYISSIPLPSPSQFHSITEYMIGKHHSELFHALGAAFQELKPYKKTLSLLGQSSLNGCGDECV